MSRAYWSASLLSLRRFACELLDPRCGVLLGLAQDFDRFEVGPVADLPRGLLGRLDDRVHLRADGLIGLCLLFLWMIEHRSSFVRAAGARELIAASRPICNL